MDSIPEGRRSLLFAALPLALVSPVPAGSFVRRVAGTPHYDGVIRGHPDPVIIAICGMGPVNYALTNPSKPGWRAV